MVLFAPSPDPPPIDRSAAARSSHHDAENLAHSATSCRNHAGGASLRPGTGGPESQCCRTGHPRADAVPDGAWRQHRFRIARQPLAGGVGWRHRAPADLRCRRRRDAAVFARRAVDRLHRQLPGQRGRLCHPRGWRAGAPADVPLRHRASRAGALGARQHGADLDAGLEEHRVPDTRRCVEHLVQPAVRGAAVGRPAGAATARPCRPDELFP